MKIGDIKRRVQIELELARIEAEQRSLNESELAKTQSSWLSKSRKLRNTVRGVMLTSNASGKKSGKKGGKEAKEEKEDPTVKLVDPISKIKVDKEGDPEVEH